MKHAIYARPIPPEPYFLTVEEAAGRLRTSKGRLRALLAGGQLRGQKSGERWLVPISAIDEYLVACEKKTARDYQGQAEHQHRNTRGRPREIVQPSSDELRCAVLELLRSAGVRCLSHN